MRAKDIFKKVDNFNEIAGYCHDTLKKVRFADEWITENFLSYDLFQKWVKETYIPEVAKAILSYNDFEIWKDSDIHYINKFGEEKTINTIMFGIYDRY